MLHGKVCVLLAAVGWLLLDPAGAHAQTWKTHRYAADGFEVKFSGEVKVVPTQIDTDTKTRVVRSTDYQQDGGTYAFIVGASLLVVDVNFENGAKQSFAALKCKTTTRDVALAFAGGRGREVHGTDCTDGSFRAHVRYFTRGKWFYQIIALFKTDGGHDAAARTFVESFKAID